MAESRAFFTRASGTRIAIADDGIVTLTYHTDGSDIVRTTTIRDLVLEWRHAGQAIAAWESAHGGKVCRFPLPPDLHMVDGGK